MRQGIDSVGWPACMLFVLGIAGCGLGPYQNPQATAMTEEHLPTPTLDPLFTMPATLAPGTPCPVTPTSSLTLENRGSFIGEFPLWLGSYNRFPWSSMGPNVLPPYSGRLNKAHWIVDQRISGDLRFTGVQLDGTGVVLFPSSSEQIERVNDTTLRLKEEPAKVGTIPNAHLGVIHSPRGYQDQGFALLIPHPGCFQIAATLSTYSVKFVFEITPD